MSVRLLPVLLLVACADERPWAWSKVPIEGAPKSTVNQLFALSENDVWGVSFPEVFHWDGKAWSVTAHDGPEHLWAVAPDDVWGVARGGSWFHWDGKRWSNGRVPEIAAQYLDFWGVVAWPNEVWATPGIEGYVRFDGTAWSVVEPPELKGWKLKRSFAIGRHYYAQAFHETRPNGKYTVKANVAHWDGEKWELIDQPPGYQIRGSAPDDVWLVLAPPRHWDGKTWSETPVPPKSGDLYDLYARSKTEAYAVGKRGVALKWDGKAWSELYAGRFDLFTVTGAATGPVWASGLHKGVVLRYPKLESEAPARH
ncbi:MAG: hypothetical protein JNK82_03805 [Myxococcaceae bacterium]|nr:hypothetical protein [Myxococcaceae bacterium]